MTSGIDRFRILALELPNSIESSHMGHPDFRVGGRIFATLSAQAQGRGMLKLSPEQQADFIADLPEIFQPVPGGWGRMGMTHILLDRADDPTMRGALTTAYRNINGKKSTRSSKIRGPNGG